MAAIKDPTKKPSWCPFMCTYGDFFWTFNLAPVPSEAGLQWKVHVEWKVWPYTCLRKWKVSKVKIDFNIAVTNPSKKFAGPVDILDSSGRMIDNAMLASVVDDLTNVCLALRMTHMTAEFVRVWQRV
jgi:hypothetical protein